VKLWIIYKDGIGFSRIIAELLQDRLDDYIDVSVGNANKIDPVFLVEEKVDYIIIGDNRSKVIPSLEIQNWLLKFSEISKKKNLIIKAISSYYISLDDIPIVPSWLKFLQNNINTEIIYPPILCLKFNLVELVLEKGANDIIKDYSNEFIEFLIKSNKELKKGGKKDGRN